MAVDAAQAIATTPTQTAVQTATVKKEEPPVVGTVPQKVVSAPETAKKLDVMA